MSQALELINNAVSSSPENFEAGMNGLSAAGLMFYGNLLPRRGNRLPVALGVVAAAFFGIGASQGGETTASIDTSESVVPVDARVIEFRPTTELKVAEALIAVSGDAQNVKAKVDAKYGFITVKKAFKENVQADGIIATDFTLDLSNKNTIQQSVNKITGKVDITADFTAGGTANTYWANLNNVPELAGLPNPYIRPFTMSDGKKNFNDQMNFAQSWAEFSSKLDALVNLDKLNNGIDAAKRHVDSEMGRLALQTAATECAPKLSDPLAAATRASLETLLVNVADISKIGDVTIKPPTTWNVPKSQLSADDINAFAELQKKGSDVTVSKVDFSHAITSCAIDTDLKDELLTQYGSQVGKK